MPNIAKTIVTLSTVAALAAPALAQSVWVAPESQKIRPTDAAGTATQAKLEAAKNEFEAFHLVLSGGKNGIKGASVAASDLTGPDGATISGMDVRVYREAMINVEKKSNDQGATGRWPDAMVPDVDDVYNEKRNAFPVDVAANEQAPIYVEYHVPADATPGDYTGNVKVTTTSGLSANVPVSLHVFAFALPSTSSLRSSFELKWNDPCIAHKGGYEQCGHDAGTIAFLKLYTRFALDHRISIDQAVYWGPNKNGDGSYDWAAWDKDYAPLLDGTMPGRLQGAKLKSVRYTWDLKDASKIAEWGKHFRAKGWGDRTYEYVCDEPPAGCAWTDIPARSAFLKQADPELRQLVTTSIEKATANGKVQNLVDTLANSIGFLERDGKNTRPLYQPWKDSNPHNQVWWYQSCDSHGCNDGDSNWVGYPTYMIDAPATLNRSMEWSSWLKRMDGEFYFATTYAWSEGDVWRTQYYFNGNGDGTIFYPGTPAKIGGTKDIPIASFRMKMIRAGMEDYEYLKLLADSGDLAMADAEASALAPTVNQFTYDPVAIDGARHRMAVRIEQLTGVDSKPGEGPAGAHGGTSTVNAPSTTADPEAATVKKGGCSATGDTNTRANALGFGLMVLAAILINRSRNA